MITSELRDGIVWITIEGEMVFEEVKREVGRWLAQKDAYCGFVTDLRGMTTIPSIAEGRSFAFPRAHRDRTRSPSV